MSHEWEVRPKVGEGGNNDGTWVHKSMIMSLRDWGHLKLNSHDGDSQDSGGRDTLPQV